MTNMDCRGQNPTDSTDEPPDDEHLIVRCAKCECRGPRRKMEKVTVLGNKHWRHEDGCPDGGER
jgi:hypothetical protein